MSDQKDNQNSEQPEEFTNPVKNSASLKGRGKDILIGEGGIPFEDDPHFQPASMTGIDAEDPFSPDSDDVNALMESLSTPAPPPVPDVAFYDRGKGIESPAPSDTAPRDLSPTDLGAFGHKVTVLTESSSETPPMASPTEPESIGETPRNEIESLLTEPKKSPSPPVIPSEPPPSFSPSRPSSSVPPMPPFMMPQAQSFEVADPFESISRRETPRPSPNLSVNPEMQHLLITSERINALWEEINTTYEIVVDDVRGHFGSTEQAIADLKHARELLLAGSANFDDAEEIVMQVKARLRLEVKVRQWAQTRGTWLSMYLITWFLLLVMGTLFVARAQLMFATQIPDWILGSWMPILMGGVGGVLGALWVLIKHIVHKRDFDPIHTPWYVTNPFMGMGLGFITYLVVRVGGGSLANLFNISNQFDFAATSIPLYLLAAIVGFQQNVLWGLLDRFVNTILPNQNDHDRNEDSTASKSQG